MMSLLEKHSLIFLGNMFFFNFTVINYNKKNLPCNTNLNAEEGTVIRVSSAVDSGQPLD